MEALEVNYRVPPDTAVTGSGCSVILTDYELQRHVWLFPQRLDSVRKPVATVLPTTAFQ
jgi:hypothetical protein